MDIGTLKRVFIGKPFPTSMDSHERLDKFRALAIFASDPISSNAYAAEAIMSVLIVLGSQALRLTIPVGLAVAALVLMVIFSYIQTILHYPDGGGAYTVTKDNLGRLPSLLAAGALLTDYILTVAVSVSAGVRAVTSAFPDLFEWRLVMALAAIILITWVNLRGVRESGTIFAIPTYAFVAGVFAVIMMGLVRVLGLFGAAPLLPIEQTVAPHATFTGFALIWVILRAFAGGTTALTGIEAISNGTQAFKAPESKNAAKTMVIMGIMAMSLFVGITVLASYMHLIPHEGESILSQMTRQISGDGFLYFWVQFFTATILFLAANTGFQDFPRLSSFLARDGFLPRWLENRGDRLVFSSGIIVLAVISSVIVIGFEADEIAMLPLYAIGVMLSFCLSQAGMFTLMGRIAHLKPGESMHTSVTEIHYESNVHWKRAVNALGSVVTFVVFLILLATKFHDGAWIVAIIIPSMVFLFVSVNNHYRRVSLCLRTKGLKQEDLQEVANVAIVPIADVHRGSLLALKYAKRFSSDVRAVAIVADHHTETGQNGHGTLEERWQRFPEITQGVKLVKIQYDYRDILTPLVEYIERVNREEFPDQITTVVIPEFIPEREAASFLHNQTARRLQSSLRQHKDIVIIDVPFHIDPQVSKAASAAALAEPCAETPEEATAEAAAPVEAQPPEPEDPENQPGPEPQP